jgi:hypothetical protein
VRTLIKNSIFWGVGEFFGGSTFVGGLILTAQTQEASTPLGVH